jgi:hypothetical protein
MALWGFATLVLAYYAKQGRPEYLVLLLVALGIQTLIVVAFAYIAPTPGSLAYIALGWVAGLALATFSAGWGASHVRAADPRELILHEPTDSGVRQLVATLTDMSWHEHGAPRRLEFTYSVANNPVLQWYLRDFPHARAVDPSDISPSGVPPTDRAIHVALQASGERWPGTSGHGFPLRRTWDPAILVCTWTPRDACRPAPSTPADAAQDEVGAPYCPWYERIDCSRLAQWLLFRAAPLNELNDTDIVALWVYDAEHQQHGD